MAKEAPIMCPECFGEVEISLNDAPGHLLQHWSEEPDPIKNPEANKRYHNLRNQIIERGGVV